MKNKKILFFSTIFILSILVIPQISFAGTLQIGESCKDNSDCISGDCEDSDLDIQADRFCVCNDPASPFNLPPSYSQDCADKYGQKPGEVWRCLDGITSSHDLHYCHSSKAGSIFPLSTETTIAVVDIQEKQKEIDDQPIQIDKPILPALGSICQLKDIQPGQASPWIANCFLGLYKYGVVFGGLIATLMLIVGGLIYITSAGNATKAGNAKTIIMGSILGVVLLLGSYLILNLINPNLVNLPSIGIEQVKIADLEIIEQSGVGAPAGWYDGKNITTVPTDLKQIKEGSFTNTKINGIWSNGFALWTSLEPTEQQEVLPYLYLQTGECPPTNLVTIPSSETDLKNWRDYKIHPSVLPAFREANQIAHEWGFELKPGSIFRATGLTGIPLWNTGIVARYIQYKKKTISGVTATNWKSNQGLISRPTCESPHNTGGAVDINLIKDGNNVLSPETGGSKTTASTYQTKFANDPYKVILEKIMNDARFVRFCGEHWHFEYGVTVRYKNWNKSARCWNYSNSIDQAIPDMIKAEANAIIGKEIF